MCFAFLLASRAWLILFSERTVSTLAIAFLTAYTVAVYERTRGTYSDLGKLNLGLGGDLGDTEGGEVLALFGQLVSERLLVFASKFVGFDSLHFA